MTDEEAELELTEADEAPGVQRQGEEGPSKPVSNPTQFTLKGGFFALTGASVWLAVMGNEKLRGPGSIVSLMALCYSSGYVLRFLDGRIKHFAARGLSPAWSGLLASAAGSTGAFLYGALLFVSASFSLGEQKAGGAMLFAALMTALLAIAAWVVVSLLGLFAVMELFNRRVRDLPMAVVAHTVDAAFGAALFSVYFAVGAAALRRFDPSQVFHWGIALAGAIVGSAFGSSAVNAHFEILDIARAKAKAEAEARSRFGV